MRKWEDIVKDKMEEFDEALPESVFAEFRALRGGSASVSTPRRFPLMWALVPAVAAGLAAIFFFRQPSAPENNLQIIQQPVQPVAVVNDSTDIAEPIQSQVVITGRHIAKPSGSGSHIAEVSVSDPSVSPQKPESPEEPESIKEPEPQEETETPNSAVTTASPFVPDNVGDKTVKIKGAPVAGVIAGGGLLAAVATPILGSGYAADAIYVQDANPVNQGDPNYGWQYSGSKDVLTGSPTHHFPFKGGLSVGIPVAQRWKVTTGLEYSLYQSSFTYSISGEKKQLAHYLGIPLRLDWTLADKRWLDVYLGGGIEGDYCIGATLAGERIKRDGFSFSVIGAGGVQFNFTKHLGIYVEPELSWTIPSENRVLETWRSEHPFTFSVTTGLRINIGK